MANNSYFKSFFTKKEIPKKYGNTYFYPIGNKNDIFNTNTYLNDFLEIPELAAILNIRARAMASWRLSIQSKATGKEQTQNETLVRILRSPNWFQSQSEFWKQASLMRDIYGNEYLYFLTPVGMPNTYKGMFVLDSSRVTIEYKSESQYFQESTGDSVKYFYDIGMGEKMLLDKSNLIHLNDNRVDPDERLLGVSKLKQLQAPLNNIRDAYKKRNIALNMPIGILSNSIKDAIGQSVPMNQKEKDKVQVKLRDRGALPIITNLGVDYSDMNINAQSMGLFEEVREDTGRICDMFGIPYELLAAQKGTTFTNLKEAKKQMYEETIIPDADEVAQALNMHIGTDKKSWHLVPDYSYLPVFAEDQKQRAISLKQMVEALSKALADQAITVEQYQNELLKFGI